MRLYVFAAVALVALFSLANASAHDGYFSDDDLDNLGWNSFVQIDEYRNGIVDPKLSPHNFRPVGHFMYYAMWRLVGLDFAWYSALIQALHLANATLLFWLMLRLGAERRPTLGAVALWLFHPALLAAHWKPMYVFDLLCGTFCLLTLLAWTHKRWVLAALAFWCAYKAKEVAIFLPAAIALYEFTVGGRRWKPLLPLLAISANFGLQAVFREKGPETAYTLHFTLDALRTTVPFYASRVGWMLVAIAGIGPKTAWMFAGFVLMVVPLLALPGRLFAVYLYVPLILVAIAAAFALGRLRWCAVAVVCLAAYQDHRAIREFRREELAAARDRHVYVETLGRYLKARAALDELVLWGTPPSMNRWGPEGAAHFLSRRHDLPVRWADTPEALRWDERNRRLLLPGLD
jgi:hypothetical protein